MKDTVCTLCGQYGHRASQCPHNRDETTRIARAHLPDDSAFGSAYVSQLAPLYGKQDKRGQHAKANHGPALTITDTSKYAPKHPKAGKPVAGFRAPKGGEA